MPSAAELPESPLTEPMTEPVTNELMKDEGAAPERKLTARGRDRKRALLDYATKRFAENGFHPTSVSDIVDGIGVGKGVFYWYFPSKDDVLREILRQSLYDLRKAQQDAIGDATDPLGRIERGIRSSLRWYENNPDILRLTNQLFAADDPDLKRPAADRRQALIELGLELYQLFTRIIEDRRSRPRDDLATLLACAQIDGAPMPPMETVGYYLIVFTAGHDTTKNALAGGMQLFLEHPGEFRRLQRHPELVNSAVEEIVRMVAPVNYMKRTTAAEAEIAGTRIPAGENLVLFYASANRDERVFEEPFSFRIDRRPNPHLGFGIGEHFCLGAHLARRSQRALWRELSRRLEWVEPAGEPAWIRSNFVVGLKRLPVRYRLRADA